MKREYINGVALLNDTSHLNGRYTIIDIQNKIWRDLHDQYNIVIQKFMKLKTH